MSAFPALRRAWDRISAATRPASALVPSAGDLWTTDAGEVFVGDGTTPVKDLVRAARLSDLTPIATAAAAASSDAAAARALALSGAAPLATVTRSTATLWEPSGTYQYPARIRPAEPRVLARVLNVGANPFQIGFGPSLTDNQANYSGSGWSAAVNPGQEWTDTSRSNRALILRSMDQSGVPLFALIYAEVSN